MHPKYNMMKESQQRCAPCFARFFFSFLKVIIRKKSFSLPTESFVCLSIH